MATATIRLLETANEDTIHSLAKLHKTAFPSFFLTQLGLPFLRALYAGYAEDRDSGLIVAEENGRIVGLIAYSNDYPRFFRQLMKKHLVKFAFLSAGAAIRNPKFIKRLFGALKKSDDVVKNEKYVELASLCVDPGAAGKGTGSALVQFLIGMVDFQTYAYINLETDADGNDGVNRFYRKNGFRLTRQYTTAEGRSMNEYRYAPEESAT